MRTLETGLYGENNFVAITGCDGPNDYKQHFLCSLTPCNYTFVRDEDIRKANGSWTGVSETIECCLPDRISRSIFKAEMLRSKYNLFLGRGDDGSSRFYDAMKLGVPQIVISDSILQSYLPFKFIIPWKHLLHMHSAKGYLHKRWQVWNPLLKKVRTSWVFVRFFYFPQSIGDSFLNCLFHIPG
jgi:hypothetical protein